MADITMCDGKGCNMKDSCYRFTAKKRCKQYYFIETPIKNDGTCDYKYNRS